MQHQPTGADGADQPHRNHLRVIELAKSTNAELEAQITRPHLQLLDPPAPVDHDTEFDEFWTAIATAAAAALRSVPGDHPDITTMRQLARNARAAAGLSAFEAAS